MITLRPAAPNDVQAIAILLGEVDRFYGATEDEPVAERLPMIREVLFGNPPSAHALLAWDDDVLVGLASYSVLWPAAGVTRSLFLKELYVTETTRRHGAGQMLMSELCRIALKTQCSRVEWTTDADNPISQQFYAKIGVPPDTSKLLYRVSGDALARLATSVAAPAGG
ncbi:MAG: GNAT family N-acetyltransferase [Chloroflexi bacterium]|nr:MAG: GNAT family N-acetyltransferase [Chloroflexota bacterium]